MLSGPRSSTVDDFWWMVWQESVTQIVMLTNIKEGGKVGTYYAFFNALESVHTT